MPSRLPPPLPRKLPTSTTKPATQHPNTSQTPFDRTSSFYLRRRSIVYAVGIAVIACTGALIGAGLKTRYEASSKALLIEQQEKSPVQRSPQPHQRNNTTSSSREEKSRISLSEEERTQQLGMLKSQIKHLEARRGLLVVKRDQTEQKLQNLKERSRARAERDGLVMQEKKGAKTEQEQEQARETV